MDVTIRRRAIAAAVTLLAGVALAAPAPTAAAAGTTISLELESPVGTTYDNTDLTGVVTPAGATRTVVIQVQVDGTWQDRDRLAASASTGAYRGSVYPHERGPMHLRVRSAGGTVVSEEVVLTVNPHRTELRAKASPNTITVGDGTTVYGTVIEPQATPRVVVQRRLFDGRWVDRQGGPVTADGRFAIRIAPSQVGVYTLRVRSAGGSRWSEPFTVAVQPRPVP